MWTPRVTVLFQVYAFMYVGVSRISGRCCGLMVGLSQCHGAHIIIMWHIVLLFTDVYTLPSARFGRLRTGGSSGWGSEIFRRPSRN